MLFTQICKGIPSIKVTANKIEIQDIIPVFKIIKINLNK
jgi:hypothetical protein